jgi:hypothetical protein
MTRRAEGTVRTLRGSDEPGLEVAPGLRLPVETVTETLAIIANRGERSASRRPHRYPSGEVWSFSHARTSAHRYRGDLPTRVQRGPIRSRRHRWSVRTLFFNSSASSASVSNSSSSRNLPGSQVSAARDCNRRTGCDDAWHGLAFW